MASSLYDLNDYIFLTEHFPPYNYVEDGVLKGISVDILVEIFKKIGIDKDAKDIIIQPWIRSYIQLENNNNVCLFTMLKSETRKNKFKWVGPTIPNYAVVIGKTSSNIVINTIDDLKKYKIGVIRGDIGEELLREASIPSTYITNVVHPFQLVKMLDSGRIDLWVYGSLPSKWIIKENNFRQGDFKELFPLDNTKGSYFAFNIDTPDEVISLFQQAFDEIVEEGVYDLILNKYLD